jgi:hypothetical protein
MNQISLKKLHLFRPYGTFINTDLFNTSTNIGFPARAEQALTELSRRDKILVEK